LLHELALRAMNDVIIFHAHRAIHAKQFMKSLISIHAAGN